MQEIWSYEIRTERVGAPFRYDGPLHGPPAGGAKVSPSRHRHPHQLESLMKLAHCGGCRRAPRRFCGFDLLLNRCFSPLSPSMTTMGLRVEWLSPEQGDSTVSLAATSTRASPYLIRINKFSR